MIKNIEGQGSDLEQFDETPNPRKPIHIPLEGHSSGKHFFHGGSGSGSDEEDWGDQAPRGKDWWGKLKASLKRDRTETEEERLKREDREYERLVGNDSPIEDERFRTDDRTKTRWRQVKRNGKWGRWEFNGYLGDYD